MGPAMPTTGSNTQMSLPQSDRVSVAGQDAMYISSSSQPTSETDDNSNDNDQDTISAGGDNASPATSYNSQLLVASSVLPFLHLPTSSRSSHQGPLPSNRPLLNETMSTQVNPRQNQTLPAMILPSSPPDTPRVHTPPAPPGKVPAPWSFQPIAAPAVLQHQPQGPTTMFSPALQPLTGTAPARAGQRRFLVPGQTRPRPAGWVPDHELSAAHRRARMSATSYEMDLQELDWYVYGLMNDLRQHLRYPHEGKNA